MELSYKDFCCRRESDQSYLDKLFIPVQGCLLEVVRNQFIERKRTPALANVLYKVLFIHVIHLQNLPPHVQNLRTTDAPGSAVISVPDVPVFL